MRTNTTAPQHSRPRRLSALAVVSLAAVVGCQGQKAAPAAPPPPGVSVIRPVLHPVQGYYEYNGYLEAVETVKVEANVKAYLEKVHFKQGSEVKKGDDLYTLDPREYEAGVAKAQADIERARADNANALAQIKLAQAELDRLKKLGTSAAANETDKAVATLAATQAQLKTAVANEQAGEAAKRTAVIQLEYTHIKARIAGRINPTLVTEGNLVGQKDPTLLTTIVRMDEMYVDFDAPERDLVEYLRRKPDPKKSAGGDFAKIEVGIANDLGYPHPGDIDLRENKVDTGSGTIRMRGLLKNPVPAGSTERLLYPGLYAKIRMPVGAERELPVIPEEALMTGQEGRYVYVLGEGDVAVKRTVTVVPQVVWKVPAPNSPQASPPWMLNPPAGEPAKMPDGSPGKPTPPKVAQSVVAIEAGLKDTDQVIVNGLQKVRPGTPVAPETWTLQSPPKKQ